MRYRNERGFGSHAVFCQNYTRKGLNSGFETDYLWRALYLSGRGFISCLPVNLGEREQQIFRLLVQQYIDDGNPVGSRTLSKMPGVNVSAASVRNVMGDLEELGLLAAPHTSAGRVPTSDGFRLFVDTMLKVQPMVEGDVGELKARLTADQDETSLLKHATDYLSGFTNMAGVVTLPKSKTAS